MGSSLPPKFPLYWGIITVLEKYLDLAGVTRIPIIALMNTPHKMPRLFLPNLCWVNVQVRPK